jgi:hypothetical protein
LTVSGAAAQSTTANLTADLLRNGDAAVKANEIRMSAARGNVR